jgi:uridine kinase
MATIADAVTLILGKRAMVSPQRALLVAVSGIDGSGKGYVTERITSGLVFRPWRVASINIDGWLQLPERRFSKERPAEHFYEHGIRFHDLFERLVLPLKKNRGVRVQADLADATHATKYHRHAYQFHEVDIVILDGIFLLKRDFRGYYDLALWVDCTFETALERALRRGQEGLSAAETIRDYDRIYFAAQRIHFANDDPRGTADLIIGNDPRLGQDSWPNDRAPRAQSKTLTTPCTPRGHGPE